MFNLKFELLDAINLPLAQGDKDPVWVKLSYKDTNLIDNEIFRTKPQMPGPNMTWSIVTYLSGLRGLEIKFGIKNSHEKIGEAYLEGGSPSFRFGEIMPLTITNFLKASDCAIIGNSVIRVRVTPIPMSIPDQEGYDLYLRSFTSHDKIIKTNPGQLVVVVTWEPKDGQFMLPAFKGPFFEPEDIQIFKAHASREREQSALDILKIPLLKVEATGFYLNKYMWCSAESTNIEEVKPYHYDSNPIFTPDGKYARGFNRDTGVHRIHMVGSPMAVSIVITPNSLDIPWDRFKNVRVTIFRTKDVPLCVPSPTERSDLGYLQRHVIWSKEYNEVPNGVALLPAVIYAAPSDGIKLPEYPFVKLSSGTPIICNLQAMKEISKMTFGRRAVVPKKSIVLTHGIPMGVRQAMKLLKLEDDELITISIRSKMKAFAMITNQALTHSSMCHQDNRDIDNGSIWYSRARKIGTSKLCISLSELSPKVKYIVIGAIGTVEKTCFSVIVKASSDRLFTIRHKVLPHDSVIMMVLYWGNIQGNEDWVAVRTDFGVSGSSLEESSEMVFGLLRLWESEHLIG